jgi:endonuclease YncB( thermonuclease family)
MRKSLGRVAFVVLILLPSAAYCQEADFTGLVARVVDGDTISVIRGKEPVKVRLEGIDAPETGQPFGTKAKQALSDKIFGQTVTIKTTGKDRYGRTLGVVWLGSRNIDLEMVAEGWAWHFKRYSKDAALADAETQARAKKAGLWADAHPIAPWDWRATEKKRRQQRAGTEPAAKLPSDPVVGTTAAGEPIYEGPRGGRYHLSQNGKKIYEKK